MLNIITEQREAIINVYIYSSLIRIEAYYFDTDLSIRDLEAVRVIPDTINEALEAYAYNNNIDLENSEITYINMI